MVQIVPPVDQLISVDLSEPGAVAALVAQLRNDRLDGLVNNAAFQPNLSVADTPDGVGRGDDDEPAGAISADPRPRPPARGGARRDRQRQLGPRHRHVGQRRRVCRVQRARWSPSPRSTAIDLAPFGVRCNAVLPGAVQTTMLFDGLSRRPHDTAPRATSRIWRPVRRSASSPGPRRSPRRSSTSSTATVRRTRRARPSSWMAGRAFGSRRSERRAGSTGAAELDVSSGLRRADLGSTSWCPPRPRHFVTAATRSAAARVRRDHLGAASASAAAGGRADRSDRVRAVGCAPTRYDRAECAGLVRQQPPQGRRRPTASTSYPLQVAAWRHATDMARMNRMTHTGSNGSNGGSAHHRCRLSVVGVGREHRRRADELDCGVQRLAGIPRASRQHAQLRLHPPRPRPRLRQRALLVVPRACPRIAHHPGHQLDDLGSQPFGGGRFVEDEVMPQEGPGTAADGDGRSSRAPTAPPTARPSFGDPEVVGPAG